MAGPRYTATYKQLMESGSPGLRIPYTTYNTVKLQTQRAAFLIKEFLCNNLAESAYSGGVKLETPWTMVWSSDGSTGPSGTDDNTDRIDDHTKFATRADSDTSAISYYVLRSGTRLRDEWAPSTPYRAGTIVTNDGHLYVCQTDGTSDDSGGPLTASPGLIADGETSWFWIGEGDGYLYLCVAYRTSQDYFLSITFSTKYQLSSPTTYMPEKSTTSQVSLPGGTHSRWLAGSDASGDRILHIAARDDGTGFWLAAARSNDVPTNGGCVVLGRIGVEHLDGVGVGMAALQLPAFLWNANATSLKSNSGFSNATLWGYNTANTVGSSLIAIASHTTRQFAFNDALLLGPFGVGAAQVIPTYSTDSYSTRRKWPLGYRFHSWPLTHVASSSNNTAGVIFGTTVDMHIGTPLGISMGLLFGRRWWCYGMLLIPNPSEVEPVTG